MPGKDDKVGAIWKKQSSKGEYFSGEIGGVQVVIFPNGFKNAPNQPDFIVYKSRPRDGAQ